MTLTWDDLPALFPAFTDPGRWLPLLQTHAAMVAEAGPHGRATAVSPEDAVKRNYAESLELLRILDLYAASPPLIDVGSGAGFPGIVIAALRPEWEIHLVEPLKKRAALLDQSAERLHLSRVTVHPLRGEEAGRGALRESAATVTARAVAALPELLEYAAPLAKIGALLALPKGSGAHAELADSGRALSGLGCQVEALVPMRPEVSSTPCAVLIRKVSVTPSRYPRRPGVPHQRPL
jgi:16S rRNA (guanine527-N7)-methyltransferase